MSHNHWTGKGKHWDIPDNEIGKGGVRRINENHWFELQAGFMRWLANSEYGRSLLHIPKDYGKIIAVRKNSVTADEGGGVFRSDFRPGAKWGNLMRSQWKEVQQAYLVYQRSLFSARGWKPSLYPVAPAFGAAYTTSTFYPDPNPESTSVDGAVSNLTNDTFANTHNASAGSSSNDSGTSGDDIRVKDHKSNGSYEWELRRTFFLFDTSAITDTDTISGATLSLYIGSKTVNSSPAGGIRIVQTSPASNTALATGDFDAHGSVDDPTAGASDVAAASIGTGAYKDFALDATGIGWITATGVSKFGARNLADLNTTSAWTANDTETTFSPSYADTSGTSSDPKLVVTHAAGGGGTAIKDIISMGLLFPR